MIKVSSWEVHELVKEITVTCYTCKELELACPGELSVIGRQALASLEPQSSLANEESCKWRVNWIKEDAVQIPDSNLVFSSLESFGLPYSFYLFIY